MAQPQFPAWPGSPLIPGGPPNQKSQFACNADRMIPAGGAMASRLVSPEFQPWQMVFRKAPPAGFYRGTHQNPFQFVLGSYLVPQNMMLAVCETRFQPYRADGLVAGEAVPLEDRRLPLALGYDVVIGSQGRVGQISAELIPGDTSVRSNPLTPSQQTSPVVFPAMPSVSSRGDSPVQFNTAYGPVNVDGFMATVQTQGVNPSQYVQRSAAGGALQPQTQNGKQGPSDMPFTFYVNMGDAVAMTVTSFAPVRIPIPFVEGVIAGYLVPRTKLEAMLQSMRPCTT